MLAEPNALFADRIRKQQRRPRVLFLYTEAMGYTEALIRALVRTFGVEVILVASDGTQKHTPFEVQLEEVTSIRRSSVSETSLRQLVDDFRPEIIYVSGWMDKNYLRTARYATSRGIKVIAGIDTQWIGSLKQRFSTHVLKRYWRRHFSHFWVPGPRQEEYAIRLGFRGRILQNFLSADTDLFNASWARSRKEKRETYPHRLLFVGRLVPVKNLPLMLTAFQAARATTRSDWRLVVAGCGPHGKNLEGIGHVDCVGFKSPLELASLMDSCGALCLPSSCEPWGVAIHEGAAAGLPLVLSDACGAGDRFLRDGRNGYLFASGCLDQLTACFIRLMQLSDGDLLRMADRSHLISRSLSPQLSASSLLEILEPSEPALVRKDSANVDHLQEAAQENELDLAA